MPQSKQVPSTAEQFEAVVWEYVRRIAPNADAVNVVAREAGERVLFVRLDAARGAVTVFGPAAADVS